MGVIAEGGVTQLNVRIPQPLHDQLRRMAEHQGIPLSAVVIRALDDFVSSEQDTVRAALAAEYDRVRREIEEFDRAQKALVANSARVPHNGSVSGT